MKLSPELEALDAVLQRGSDSHTKSIAYISIAGYLILFPEDGSPSVRFRLEQF